MQKFLAHRTVKIVKYINYNLTIFSILTVSIIIFIIWFFSERAMAPHSSTLPGESHGRKSLVSCSLWGRKESDTTEQLHFHFSLSCIGEGNGNPLQCSCLENPRDGGAWWAAVSGVAQSRTRLKRLSSISSSSSMVLFIIKDHNKIWDYQRLFYVSVFTYYGSSWVNLWLQKFML